MRLAGCTLAIAAVLPLFGQQFDIVITGGRIVDGAGDPWFYGDVGIKGDTITAITRQAMFDGAFGVTTGLFYVPGNFTPTEEVIGIEKVVGAMGGTHHCRMRDEASHVLDRVSSPITKRVCGMALDELHKRGPGSRPQDGNPSS